MNYKQMASLLTNYTTKELETDEDFQDYKKRFNYNYYCLRKFSKEFALQVVKIKLREYFLNDNKK